MSTSSSRNPSRRTSKSGPVGQQEQPSHSSSKSGSDRRLKAKSTQIDSERRRGSRQADGNVSVASERPAFKGRVNSAPLVNRFTENDEKNVKAGAGADGESVDAQDEDEVAGVVGAVKHFQPFKSSELAESLPDINIAVIGFKRVGKSTFMQKALDLPFPSDSHAVERKIGIDGNDYLLRLLELSLVDLEFDDDGTIIWPEAIEDKLMPQIDGAVTLYDVGNGDSLEDVGKTLSAIDRGGIPSLLVSAKCDIPEGRRKFEPDKIERMATHRLKRLETLRVGADAPGSHQEGISLILRAIVSSVPSDELKLPSVSRVRAQSNATRSTSPRPPSDRGHLRSASEYTGSLYKEKTHLRHDSSLASYSATDRLKAHNETSEEEMPGSFLIEESDGESSEGESAPVEDTTAPAAPVVAPSTSFYTEDGVTVEQLVDRLLAQPTSKADNKFAAIFLALYRKFASPGQLLEAIALHFGKPDEGGATNMVKTSDQLRILAILQLWTSTYPGDFAYPQTKRRMRTLISKLSDSRIFAAAAKEIAADLDATKVDDDTNWACCDKDRLPATTERFSISSIGASLIDDPAFPLADDLTLRTTFSEETLALDNPISRTTSHSSSILSNIETAQQQATLLQPIPRQPVTKTQWRLLIDYPDDLIARELTRIDWIMFCSIRPRDLVRQVSLTKAEKAGCKNVAHVNRMIEHFNQLAFWVENYVLLRDKPKHRALMLEKFMRVARKLREMNNYNALGALIAGIKSSAVHRLAATRDLIPPSVGRDWMKLEILMAPSKSFAAYRLAWDNSSGERIPYLPLHRRDLVSAEEGNKTWVGDGGEKEGGRINWKKFEIMGEVVVSMQKAQGVPYKDLGGARANEGIKELVLDVKLVKDEDELFERSKQLEPSGALAVGPTAKFKELLFKR